MEVLSPRSANLPSKSRTIMKKSKLDPKSKPEEKPSNPDRIDEKWRPLPIITEPGNCPETYDIGKKLGKGGFAVCFEGKTRSNSQVLALKVVKAYVEQKKMMEKFRTELQIHAKLQHPNIVQFLRAFTSDQHTYVVLELCPNGNLTDMVKARTSLSLPEVRRFMIQICGGVKYMHKRSVIHRDLKMGNIFLDGRMNIKIGDFGLAAVMADEQDRRTTLCGTPNYIAPEILSKSGSRGHDNKVDTWAVGVICYAMLIGTPPFQSKTQQEIYSKLRTLEYEWKVDSQNYIPHQAKDFVASCLNLVSSERPEMDDLVDHEFFTMGVIADTLDTSCLKLKPVWLENADPRGDRVRSGYGISHPQMCKDCGVGRTPDGRLRSAIGGKANISTLVEIEIENRRGCAPTVPLPEGILYKHFAEAQEEWSKIQKHPLQPPKPRSRKILVETENFPERAHSSEQARPVSRHPVLEKQSPTRPVPEVRPVQSFAAQQRQQALPPRAIQQTRNLIGTKPESLPLEAADTATASAQGLLRAKPMRAASTRVTRSTSSRVMNMPTRTLPKSTTLSMKVFTGKDQEEKLIFPIGKTSGKPLVSTTMSDSDPQYRAPSHFLSRNIEPKSLVVSEEVETNGQVDLPRINQDKVVEQLQAKSSVCKESSTHRAMELRFAGIATNSGKGNPDTDYQPRIISSSDPYTVLPRTSAAETLVTLRNMHQALCQQGLSERFSVTRDKTSSRRLRARPTYPRVDKWVDYATRHGIAYILTDGTLGMILKSSDDNTKPSSCVVVRNARAHTIKRAKGTEQQFVPQGRNASDVEFYEQCSTSSDMNRLKIPCRKFMLDLKAHPSQMAASNAIQETLSGSAAERMREVCLLDKFGKYMNKQIGNTDVDIEFEAGIMPSENFIHFYQRLGNVGVWRFADGGLQFNFPDHTKLTMYQEPDPTGEGKYMIDLIHLDPADATNLNRKGVLVAEGLERRGLVTWELESVLSNSLRRAELEIIKSNEIKEKLSWIRAVIGCWIREGGVGKTGDEKLGWSGLQERREDKRINLQWVTVGRLGGDN